MQGYGVNIVVEGGELEKILARLSAAQEEIQQCYFELERLGVLVIKKPSDESDGKKDHCSVRDAHYPVRHSTGGNSVSLLGVRYGF